jgi:Fe-S cluster biogenesis protein NfuA
VRGIIVDHFASGAPLLSGAVADEATFDDPADADIVAQIRELLETRVRPAVANDGGDIVYRGFQQGIVYLHMQGSCAGCPSSTATLKGGIENLLRHYVPEVQEVRAV